MAIESVAIGWEMYLRTDSAFTLGLVGLIQAIPLLVFTLPGGYFADVFDRKRLIQFSLAGTTFTSLCLGFLSMTEGPTVIMFVLLLFGASCNSLASPARFAIFPQLVPPEVLENGIRWRSMSWQVSSVVGPALGGLIIVWSLPSAYFLSASGSLLCLLILFFVSFSRDKSSPPGSPLGQLMGGITFVKNSPILLGAISLDLFAVLLGGAVYLLPIYARDYIDLSPLNLEPEQALGWLRAMPAVGALFMAIYLTYRPPMRHAGRDMFLAVAGFGVATIVFGLSRNFWLSMTMLFFTGFFDMISVVIRHTLLQLHTPNEMRGRVSAVNSLFIGSSNELGGFESGVVARIFNPVVSVVSGGVGTLLVVCIWATRFPSLRKLKKLEGEKTDPSP